MLAKLCANHACWLLPGIAVAVLYAAFGAIPQYRQLRSVQTESQSQSEAISQLMRRAGTLARVSNSSSVDAVPTSGAGRSANPPTNLKANSQDAQTFAQSFARILATFHSESVACISALPEDAAAENAPDSAQRLILTGGFAEMLAAMEMISTDVPNALATNLSMRRSAPSDPCRWEIVFLFDEGAE